MSLSHRKYLFAARIASAAAAVLLRGRARAAAWAAHEVLRIGPSLIRNNDWYGPVTKEFPATRRDVWLTIDDGPDRAQTPQILDLLERHSARASFFVIGKHVDWNRSLCREIVAAGHTVENHTYSHPSALFWTLPCCAIRAEIVRCSHAIQVATGVAPRWFRSPAGMTNACVHPAAARAWLRVAGWSAAGFDGTPGIAPETVVARIMRRVRPGSIILVHEGAGRRAVATVSLLLDQLADAGFTCRIPDPAGFR